MITLKHQDLYFRLNVSENTHLLESCQEISYDKVCEHERSYRYHVDDEESRDCDHEYNRCQVIQNVEKGEFDLHSYLKTMLHDRDLNGQNEIVTEELFCSLIIILSDVDFREFVDYQVDRGYYGESLSKECHALDQLEGLIKEAINSHKEAKIEVHENV